MVRVNWYAVCLLISNILIAVPQLPIITAQTRRETPLDNFFAQYPSFSYDFSWYEQLHQAHRFRAYIQMAQRRVN